MQTYDVTSDVIAVGTTAAALARRLGTAVEEARKVEQSVLYRAESGCTREQAPHEHIAAILSKTAEITSLGTDDTIKEIYLNIGVFFYNAYSSVTVEGELLRRLTERFPDIKVEVTCYPCTESE